MLLLLKDIISNILKIYFLDLYLINGKAKRDPIPPPRYTEPERSP